MKISIEWLWTSSVGQAKDHSGLMPPLSSCIWSLWKSTIAEYVKIKPFLIFLQVSPVIGHGSSCITATDKPNSFPINFWLILEHILLISRKLHNLMPCLVENVSSCVSLLLISLAVPQLLNWKKQWIVSAYSFPDYVDLFIPSSPYFYQSIKN